MLNMCECFQKTLGKIELLVKPYECNDFKIDWSGRILRFDGGFGVGLYVEAEYYKIKKNGEQFANKSKDKRFVALSFCPFCGKSLNSDKNEKTNQNKRIE